MTNVTTKEFTTSAVLGVVTGRLLGPMGDIYEVANWMTGESVFTHQLPRICREAQPIIVAMHPTLSEAIAEAEQVTEDNWRDWLTMWEDRYGPIITVPLLNADQHERIDPLSELAERVHPDQIIVVPSPPASRGE